MQMINSLTLVIRHNTRAPYAISDLSSNFFGGRGEGSWTPWLGLPEPLSTPKQTW